MLLTVSLTLLVIIEVHASLALTRVWPHPPEVYRDLDPSAVLAEFPAPADIADAAGDTRYMYFSVFHWRRLLNGYSGFLPASYLEFMMRMHSFPDPDALAYLADRHADFIIVHGAFMETNKYLDTRRVLDRNPSVTLVKRFNWEGREGSVYRLIRSAPR